MSAHQEYQRTLHEFKDWLEQQQERLSCYTQLEGDVETLEDTLRKLQVRRRLEVVIVKNEQMKHYLFILSILTIIVQGIFTNAFIFSCLYIRKKNDSNDSNTS